jgi:hypothetical protein
MKHLWLRIAISATWLIIATLCVVFLVIPCTNINYHGNLYFDNQADYNLFKKALADSTYTIRSIDVVNDGGHLVRFNIDIPKTAEFPYGKKDDPTALSVILIFIGAGALSVVTGYLW